ncbi:MAG: hypothetical protein ABEH38_04370 [Flavobacteriales bacterium]
MIWGALFILFPQGTGAQDNDDEEEGSEQEEGVHAFKAIEGSPCDVDFSEMDKVFRRVENDKLVLTRFYDPEKVKTLDTLWRYLLDRISKGTLKAYRSGPANNVTDFSEGTFHWPSFKKEVILDSCDHRTMNVKIPYHTEPKDVSSYVFQELWYWDELRNTIDVRILGLAPYIVKKVPASCRSESAPENEIVGTKFWVPFPPCSSAKE